MIGHGGGLGPGMSTLRVRQNQRAGQACHNCRFARVAKPPRPGVCGKAPYASVDQKTGEITYIACMQWEGVDAGR